MLIWCGESALVIRWNIIGLSGLNVGNLGQSIVGCPLSVMSLGENMNAPFSSLRVEKCNKVSRNCAHQNSANQMPVGKFRFPFPSYALMLFLVVLGIAAAPGQAQTVSFINGTKTVSLNEGNPSAAPNFLSTVRVVNGAPATAYTVSYTTQDGTAKSSTAPALPTQNDYTFTSGSNTVTTDGAGQATFNITVPVNSDAYYEDDESFTLKATLGASSDTATGNILNYDGVPSIQFVAIPDDATNAGAADSFTIEGAAGTSRALTFRAVPSQPSGKTLMIGVTTQDGSATGAATGTPDFTRITVADNVVLTLPADTTTQNFTTTVNGDNLDEQDETFTVTPYAVAGGIATAKNTPAQGTIKDDDAPSASISDVTVTEGNSGSVNATFRVDLGTTSVQTVSIDYRTVNSGAAVAGKDYTAVSGRLTFPAGVTNSIH